MSTPWTVSSIYNHGVPRSGAELHGDHAAAESISALQETMRLLAEAQHSSLESVEHQLAELRADIKEELRQRVAADDTCLRDLRILRSCVAAGTHLHGGMDSEHAFKTFAEGWREEVAQLVRHHCAQALPAQLQPVKDPLPDTILNDEVSKIKVLLGNLQSNLEQEQTARSVAHCSLRDCFEQLAQGVSDKIAHAAVEGLASRAELLKDVEQRLLAEKDPRGAAIPWQTGGFISSAQGSGQLEVASSLGLGLQDLEKRFKEDLAKLRRDQDAKQVTMTDLVAESLSALDGRMSEFLAEHSRSKATSGYPGNVGCVGGSTGEAFADVVSDAHLHKEQEAALQSLRRQLSDHIAQQDKRHGELVQHLAGEASRNDVSSPMTTYRGPARTPSEQHEQFVRQQANILEEHRDNMMSCLETLEQKLKDELEHMQDILSQHVSTCGMLAAGPGDQTNGEASIEKFRKELEHVRELVGNHQQVLDNHASIQDRLSQEQLRLSNTSGSPVSVLEYISELEKRVKELCGIIMDHKASIDIKLDETQSQVHQEQSKMAGRCNELEACLRSLAATVEDLHGALVRSEVVKYREDQSRGDLSTAKPQVVHFSVFDSGLPEFDGGYFEDGIKNGKPKYRITGGGLQTCNWWNGYWYFSHDFHDCWYKAAGDDMIPPENGWFVGSNGRAPAPLLKHMVEMQASSPWTTSTASAFREISPARHSLRNPTPLVVEAQIHQVAVTPCAVFRGTSVSGSHQALPPASPTVASGRSHVRNFSPGPAPSSPLAATRAVGSHQCAVPSPQLCGSFRASMPLTGLVSEARAAIIGHMGQPAGPRRSTSPPPGMVLRGDLSTPLSSVGVAPPGVAPQLLGGRVVMSSTPLGARQGPVVVPAHPRSASPERACVVAQEEHAPARPRRRAWPPEHPVAGAGRGVSSVASASSTGSTGRGYRRAPAR